MENKMYFDIVALIGAFLMGAGVGAFAQAIFIMYIYPLFRNADRSDSRG
jgi:hypothetical protein